jgi:hypothetical protein
LRRTRAFTDRQAITACRHADPHRDGAARSDSSDKLELLTERRWSTCSDTRRQR